MARTKRGKARAAGYRSGFELEIRDYLQRHGVGFEYEKETYQILVPATPGHLCECGAKGKSIQRKTKYTPDFTLANGLVVEAKGQFTPANRKTILAFTNQYPAIPFRMVFQRDNPLKRGAKSRYTDWCEQHGIQYSIGSIPLDWAEETFDNDTTD